jgi:tetratricopeptide (TPR) repeat protein
MNRPTLLIALLVAAGAPAWGQAHEYRLKNPAKGAAGAAAAGEWVQVSAPEPGTDAALIAEARKLLAEGRPRTARQLIDPWIRSNSRKKGGMLLAEAYIVRGDARTASGEEFDGLYDYEEVVNGFPGTEQFVTALERELEIGVMYLNGLKRKFLGLRIDAAEAFGEELLVRVQERLPGSRLAERAGIELADYYYRVRDMSQAAEAYEIFLVNFPKSEYRQKAMQRRIYANIATFKGPKYDAAGLQEAERLIEHYAALYPADAEKAGLGNALVARLDESAAAQMLDTARWYLRQRDEVSAKLTLRRLIKKHPETVAASMAMQIQRDRGWAAAEPVVPAMPAERPVETPAPSGGPSSEGTR